MMTVSLGVMLNKRVDRPWGLEESAAFTCRLEDIYQTTQHHNPEDSTRFGHLLCLSSGVLYCTFSTGKFRAGL